MKHSLPVTFSWNLAGSLWYVARTEGEEILQIRIWNPSDTVGALRMMNSSILWLPDGRPSDDFHVNPLVADK